MGLHAARTGFSRDVRSVREVHRVRRGDDGEGREANQGEVIFSQTRRSSMLVLSRRENEELVVTVPPSDQPQEIRIHVCRCSALKTRIGLVAPRHVVVMRPELLDAENEKGA